MLWEPFGHVCNSFPCNTFAKHVVTGLGRFRIPERNVRVPFGDKIAAAIPVVSFCNRLRPLPRCRRLPLAGAR